MDRRVGEHLPDQAYLADRGAVEEWSTPPARTERRMAGSETHLTAYITSPGKASTKASVAAVTAAGRRQCIGSSGRCGKRARSLNRRAGGSTSEEATSKPAMERGTHGRTGAQSVQWAVEIFAGSDALEQRSPAARDQREEMPAQRNSTAGDELSGTAVLRIAADRSANIGDSLDDHRPTGRLDRKGRTRYVVAVLQRSGARGTCVSASPEGDAGDAI